MILMVGSGGGLGRSVQCLLSIWYSGTLPARGRDDIGNFKGDLVAESLESEKKRDHRRNNTCSLRAIGLLCRIVAFFYRSRECVISHEWLLDVDTWGFR